VEDLLDALDQGIIQAGAKAPSRNKRNRDAMRLLLDVDGYTPEQVRWIIGWATRHEFWRTNVLSASKLRAQFERLKLEAMSGRGGTQSRPTTNDRMQQTLDLAAQLDQD